MKKITSLLTLSFFALALLSGCGNFAYKSKTVENMDPNEAMQNLYQDGNVVFSKDYVYYIGEDNNIYEFNKKTRHTIVIQKEEISTTSKLLLDDNKLYFLRKDDWDEKKYGPISEMEKQAKLKYFDLKTKKAGMVDFPISSSINSYYNISYSPTKYGLISYSTKDNLLKFTNGSSLLSYIPPFEYNNEIVTTQKATVLYSPYSVDDKVYYIISDVAKKRPEKLMVYNLKTREEKEISSVYREINNIKILEIEPGIFVPDIYKPENGNYQKREKEYVPDKQIFKGILISNKYYQAKVDQNTGFWIVDEYDLNGNLTRNIIDSDLKIESIGIYVYNNNLYAQVNRKIELDEKLQKLSGSKLEHITASIYKVNLN